MLNKAKKWQKIASAPPFEHTAPLPYTLWLGVDRFQLCLQDISPSGKWNGQAAVGQWVSLCVYAVLYDGW